MYRKEVSTIKYSRFYNEQMINDLQYILDNGFCYRTAYKACKRYNEIKDNLLLEDKQAIYCILYNMYVNYCFDDCSHKCAADDLATTIKAIQNRRYAVENINICSYDTTIEYAEKHGYNLKINPDFINDRISSKIQYKDCC